MNCIFICVFSQEKYVEMFLLLLKSILLYGELFINTDILVYTSTEFMNIIKKNKLCNEKIIFEINDVYENIDQACKARLDVFELQSIHKYNKILYLDTDIIIKNNIEIIFSLCIEETLYAVAEGSIDAHYYWGTPLFGNEINNYEDKIAFSSGILLFKNCDKIRNLFNIIKQDIITRKDKDIFNDQPFIVYNAFKYNLYNNKVLNIYAVNNNFDIRGNTIIHHFPGGPGIYQFKLENMKNFLTDFKNNVELNNLKLSINQ